MSIIEIQDYEGDYKEIFSLLEVLTESPVIDKSQYDYFVKNLDENHYIFVYIKDSMPVGIITLIIEPKLIHGGCYVGHIEDLAVDKAYRNQGISTALIKKCVDISRINACYKVILDCNEKLLGLYEKSGFFQKEVQMRYDL